MSYEYTSKAMTKLNIDQIFARVGRIAFLLSYLVFIGLLFLRHYFGVDFPVFIYLAVIAFACVTGNKNQLLALAVCCVCFPAVFQYKYAIIMICAAYVIKHLYDFKYTVISGKSNYGVLTLLFMLLIWELLHVAVYDKSVSEYFRSFVEIIFIFIMLIDVKKDFDYPLIVRYVAFSALVSCALILLLQIKFSEFTNIADYFTDNRFGYGVEQYRNFDPNFNPNILGLICVVPASALVQLIVTGRSKFFDYIFLLALLGFSLMTMSRKVVLMYAVLFAFVFFYLMNVKKRGIVRSIIYFLLIGLSIYIVITVLNSLLPTVMESFNERFAVEDISNGRNDLFEDYNLIIAEHPSVSLFGWGLQGTVDARYYYGVENVSHNGTQELILCWGVEGLILFAAFIVMLIMRNYNKRKELINYLILAEVIIFSQFAQMITSSAIVMFFAVAYLSLCYEFNKKRQNKNLTVQQ